jgi:hypothetical protein
MSSVVEGVTTWAMRPSLVGNNMVIHTNLELTYRKESAMDIAPGFLRGCPIYVQTKICPICNVHDRNASVAVTFRKLTNKRRLLSFFAFFTIRFQTATDRLAIIGDNEDSRDEESWKEIEAEELHRCK